jgi:hypothetical protein
MAMRSRTLPSSTRTDRSSSPRPAGASSVSSAPTRKVSASVIRVTPERLRSSVASTPLSGS